ALLRVRADPLRRPRQGPVRLHEGPAREEPLLGRVRGRVAALHRRREGRGGRRREGEAAADDPPRRRPPPGDLRWTAAVLLRRRHEAGRGSLPERLRVRRALARRPRQRPARAVGLARSPQRDHSQSMGRGAAQGGSGLRLLAALAAGSMIAGAFAPWGSITAAVMGSGSPVLAVPGIRVGLDAGVITWGWVVLAAGAIGAVGVLGDAGLALTAGFVGAVAAVADLALFGRDGQLFLPRPIADLVQTH